MRNTETKLRNTEIHLRNTEIQLRNTEIQLRNTEIQLRNTEIQLRNTNIDAWPTIGWEALGWGDGLSVDGADGEKEILWQNQLETLFKDKDKSFHSIEIHLRNINIKKMDSLAQSTKDKPFGGILVELKYIQEI